MGSSGSFVGRESGFLVLSNAVLVLVLEAPKSQRFFRVRARKKLEAYPPSHNNSRPTKYHENQSVNLVARICALDALFHKHRTRR